MSRSFAPSVLLALASFLPAIAFAQAEVCQVTGFAAVGGVDLDCDALRSCSSDDDCDGGSLPMSCDPVGGFCLPECSTTVTCRAQEDCAAFDAEAVCVFTGATTGLEPSGFCELPALPLTYCEFSGTVSDAAFVACHTLPFSDTLTPSWFDGDCDRDGCPNNNDPSPCEVGRVCGAPAIPERTCHRRLFAVEFEQCTLTRSAGETTLSCAAPHPCDRGRPSTCPGGFACPESACEPTVCGTLYSCRTDEDCGSTPLGAGSCLAAPEIFGVDRGGDGFCTFESFGTDARCVGMVTSCLVTPSGLPTLDFFQGDCDADGCPNGSDDAVCEFGYGTCTATMSLACGTALEMPTDAGVPLVDGGSLDAGVPFDAGVSFDAPLLDAPPPPSVSFAGGGGFRCAAAPAPRASLAPIALLAVALALLRRRS